MAQDGAQQTSPAAGPPGTPRAAGPRRGRLGLYLPFILLALLAVLWSAAWLYIRNRAATEMDAWLAREAAAGRSWTCADRTITGYPFRLELRCGGLSFARSDGTFSLGPVTALVQVYQPRHALFEAAGPFRVRQGDLTGEANWSRLRGSFHGTSGGFLRASLAVDEPRIEVAGAVPQPVSVSAQHLELHARPTPGRFDTDGAVDVSLRLAQGVAPLADAFIGNDWPADLAFDGTLTRATLLRTGTVVRELERWREAGGSLDIAGLSLVKGASRLQAKGGLGLDEAHRLAGQIELRAAGVEGLVASIVGQRFGADRGALVGNLIGGLLGGVRAPRGEATAPGETPLKPLPPLRLVDGRVLFGPFQIPNVRLEPLY